MRGATSKKQDIRFSNPLSCLLLYRLNRTIKNGGKRTRTADPLHAMQVLYQLSYTPETNLNVTYSANKCRSDRYIFLFCLLIFNGLLTGCHLPLEKWQLKSQQTLAEIQSTSLSFHFEPPRGLEVYTAPTLKLQILHQIPSTDKYGHHRIQVYLYMPGENRKELIYREVVSQYKNDFDIIWIYLLKQPLSLEDSDNWKGQAAWFAPHIPPHHHHHTVSQPSYSYGLYSR